MISREVRLLLWLLLAHVAGIYLFTKGFLLSRLALPDHSTPSSSSPSSLATHTRAILLVIDALRFDFISPHPPSPPSPFHHNILTLPHELTTAHPEHSFIFNAHADPPTTTLQRIKGLTTGSLPTFVDVGESFGGEAIHEDSVVHQVVRAGRKVALAGDNTWLTLFPDILTHNLSFPFDSFNVEDLHTVDDGVIAHLLPLIAHHSHSWGLAIGHGLGVDHVGHRLGPDHPTMKSKLEQMNAFLADVVDTMHDDTLLVVLGDHGMDRTGNHGGDSILETMSAVWIYSKGPPLSHRYQVLPDSILPTTVFPGESLPQRFIQQIDLVPTLSLLLGLPIPFNNLGSVVPEVFNRDVGGSGVRKALEVNAAQIKRYLDAYRASPSAGELDSAWSELSNAWSAATNASVDDDAFTTLFGFNSLALSTCRALWAQFNLVLMVAGLIVIATSIAAAYGVYRLLGDAGDQWEEALDSRLSSCLRAGAVGLVVGGPVYYVHQSYLDGILLHHVVLFTGALASNAALVLTTASSFHFRKWTFSPFILILHTLCFASNSFTVWEDAAVLFLLQTSLVPSVLVGFTAPTSRLRYRILGFSAVFAVCVRLMGMSTVCREEQHPYCTVTFYASPTSSAPPLLALLLAPLVAFAVPRLVHRVLGISKSDRGLAEVYLPWMLTPALLAGTGFWVLEWVQSTGWGGAGLRMVRTGMAVSVLGVVGASVGLWWVMPVCLEIQRTKAVGDGDGDVAKTQITILGFANAFGSPYLIFWTMVLAVMWLCTQLAGQIVLGLATLAFLAHLEITDSVRDVHALTASLNPTLPPPPALTFSSLTPLALLGLHTFYGTGHQPTLPSLQWKTAFVLSERVWEGVSGWTVGVNTFGGMGLVGVGVPLVGLWNLAPRFSSSSASSSTSSASSPSSPPPPAPSASSSPLRASLALSTYYTTLTLGSALCAAVLRRHLMVWKVFAPRYGFGAAQGLVVDVGIVLGVWGVLRVRGGVGRVLGVR